MAKVAKKFQNTLSQGELTEQIRKVAQELCQKRGCAPDNDWQDWFEAERIVKQKLSL